MRTIFERIRINDFDYDLNMLRERIRKITYKHFNKDQTNKNILKYKYILFKYCF